MTASLECLTQSANINQKSPFSIGWPRLQQVLACVYKHFAHWSMLKCPLICIGEINYHNEAFDFQLQFQLQPMFVWKRPSID